MIGADQHHLARVDRHGAALMHHLLLPRWCGQRPGADAVCQMLRHGRARPQITVAASPRLYVLCKDDCANIGRRQDGALTIYAWAARRFGCDLRWEEVSA